MNGGRKLGEMGQVDVKAALAASSAVFDQAASEDDALRASGEILLPLAGIAKKLGVAKADLLRLVAPLPAVRYISDPLPAQYCVRDVVEAFAADPDQRISLLALFAPKKARG